MKKLSSVKKDHILDPKDSLHWWSLNQLLESKPSSTHSWTTYPHFTGCFTSVTFPLFLLRLPAAVYDVTTSSECIASCYKVRLTFYLLLKLLLTHLPPLTTLNFKNKKSSKTWLKTTLKYHWLEIFTHNIVQESQSRIFCSRRHTLH